MLLVKFDLQDLEKCKTVADVYRTMGIGVTKDDVQDLNFDNNEVFGKRAFYANLFLNPKTSEKISNILHESSKLHGWFNYSPVTGGERYDQLENEIGEINESVLYIATPEDKLYIEDPHAGKE